MPYLDKICGIGVFFISSKSSIRTSKKKRETDNETPLPFITSISKSPLRVFLSFPLFRRNEYELCARPECDGSPDINDDIHRPAVILVRGSHNRPKVTFARNLHKEVRL